MNAAAVFVGYVVLGLFALLVLASLVGRLIGRRSEAETWEPLARPGLGRHADTSGREDSPPPRDTPSPPAS